jgi:peptidoglycan/LPS O-acetylase OafA/YrhL
MKRLPGLDLLRALAIAWVMLYHLESYGLRFPGIVRHGWMGVDLFFVLSGYLIGWQLLKPYASGGQPDWRQFVLRRACRVLPAYWAVLALSFAVPAVRESEGSAPLWQFLTFTTNLFPDYFHHRAFSHAWSLCVEEHFYLLLPPIAWLVAKWPGRTKVMILGIVMLAGGMLLRGWLWQHQVAPYRNISSGEHSFLLRYVEVIYNPTYNRLDGLLAGVMLAATQAFVPHWWSRAMEWGRPAFILGLAGLVASTCIEPTGYLGAVIVFPLVAASFACLVVAALSRRTWLGRFPVPGARHIAAISFSLYLTHKQVYFLVHEYAGSMLDEPGFLAFCAYNAAALAVAALLYATVERAGLRLRDRLTLVRHPRRAAIHTV